MRRFLSAAVIAAVTLFGAAPLQAVAQAPDASARDRVVVSAAWLARHVNDPDLVLLHVGAKPTYDAGHIANARYVNFRDLATGDGTAPGLTLEMLPTDVLHDRLAALGISDRSRVVVYQSDDQWTQSTRVMLTLDYAGLAGVSWLDGGQKAWTKAGQPLSTDPPAAKTGTLSPLKPRPIVVDADFVKAHLNTPAFAVVDARLPAFYEGSRTGGRAPAEHKTGHIAGALNAPFDSFTSADVQLKPAEDIAAVFVKAGVKPGDTVIGYCHIGQQATAMLFAARSLGYRVLLYDGSFEDWSTRDLPVDNPRK
ncbi:MAG TPA: rhodanese-like domain-containing protein [Vicinamibacterales bacterium]